MSPLLRPRIRKLIDPPVADFTFQIVSSALLGFFERNAQRRYHGINVGRHLIARRALRK